MTTRKAKAIALAVTAGCGVMLLSGCRSAFVDATLKNDSGGRVTLVELQYPSASFGVGELAQGAEYHYRFQILNAKATKLTWTDATGMEHSSGGPYLKEGQQGTLTVTIGKDSARWDAGITNR